MTGSMRRSKTHSSKRRGGATIGDIAAAAGVSKMTVSRFLSAPSTVRDETRERIQQLIDELHYVPNRSARALSGTGQLRLGLLYNLPRSSYIVDFLMGAIEQAAVMDIQLVSRSVRVGVDAADILRSIIASGIDGLALTPPLCDATELLEIIAESDLPVLLVGTRHPEFAMSSISIDERAAACDLTRHIIDQGHRRIGFIIGEPLLAASHIRLEGFRAAMAAAGLAIDPDLLVQGDFTYRSGLTAAERLLSLPQPPTAIFASNDDMAAAAVMVAHRMALDVPRELSVCGFDDSWIATNIYPELTTIRQPIHQMAINGVAVLGESVRASRNGQDMVKHQIVPYELVVRQSDGHPRADAATASA